MNILVVSYADYITDLIRGVIEQKYKEASIDVVKGTSKASYLTRIKEYDLIIIDMMVQKYPDEMTEPILQPAMKFLREVREFLPTIKAFALFDEDETDKKGQDEIEGLGYEIAAYDASSIEWERKLYNYI